jgi:hypothetical protein
MSYTTRRADVLPGGGRVPNYRVYCYDGVGKLRVADWIDAASDDAALSEARTMKVAVKCEVWQRDRLVGTIETPRDTRQSETSER